MSDQEPPIEAQLAAPPSPHHSAASAPNTGEAKPPLIDRPWFIVVLVLHMGLLGIPIYWKMNYSVATRMMIIVASAIYTVFAVVVIWWSLKQIINAFGAL